MIFITNNHTNRPAGKEIKINKNYPEITSPTNNPILTDLHNKGNKRIRLDLNLNNQNTPHQGKQDKKTTGVNDITHTKINWREKLTYKIPKNLIPKSTPPMVKMAIANAYKHGIVTRAGRPNPAQGDCSFESVLDNLNY